MLLELEERMVDRLMNGFENWNSGYESWLEWCETLYEPDAHYNVYGKRFTLEEYKKMMGHFFQQFDIELGEFDNIIARGDWIAIRYVVYITNKQTGEKTRQQTMEFVNFKDNPDPVGARVKEGWALSDHPLG